MKTTQRISSLVLSAVLALSLVSPAFAAEQESEYVSQDTFWNWAAENTSGLLSAIISYGSEDVCTVNEDGRHRASSYQRDRGRGYYTCICDACGKNFTAYETDVKQSYGEQVEALPAHGFNSDGSLLWSPKFKDFYLYYMVDGMNVHHYYAGCPHFELPSGSSHNVDTSVVLSTDCDAHSIAAYPKSGSSSFNVSSVNYRFADVRPIDGFYECLETVGIEGYYITSSGRTPFSKLVSSSNSVYYDASTSIELKIDFSLGSRRSVMTLYSHGFAPVYKITPLASVLPSVNTTYSINTRPTSITGGNYGIVGDNGQITTVTDNSSIVNETHNTYYNPATGQTGNITDWTYDYSDRSYHVTYETTDSSTGDTTTNTATVTYGDENITITENSTVTEGDTTSTVTNNYTIYYIVEGTGTGPGTHTHDWRETSVTDATCLQSGKRVYTCAVCGDTKQETIPALGHDWLVLRTVNNEYDEDGIQITDGYILYQCDRCHTQYKTTDTSTRPSPGGGTTTPGTGSSDDETGGNWFTKLLNKIGEFIGSTLGALLELFGGILTGLLDKLISLVTGVIESLASLVDLFGSFGEALGVLWTWLPPEIMAVLVAGVSIFVLVALLKLFMK